MCVIDSCLLFRLDPPFRLLSCQHLDHAERRCQWRHIHLLDGVDGSTRRSPANPRGFGTGGNYSMRFSWVCMLASRRNGTLYVGVDDGSRAASGGASGRCRAGGYQRAWDKEASVVRDAQEYGGGDQAGGSGLSSRLRYCPGSFAHCLRRRLLFRRSPMRLGPAAAGRDSAWSTSACRQYASAERPPGSTHSRRRGSCRPHASAGESRG